MTLILSCGTANGGNFTMSYLIAWDYDPCSLLPKRKYPEAELLIKRSSTNLAWESD